MMNHAFALGYHCVAWRCNALNAASMRAARRFGFTQARAAAGARGDRLRPIGRGQVDVDRRPAPFPLHDPRRCGAAGCAASGADHRDRAAAGMRRRRGLDRHGRRRRDRPQCGATGRQGGAGGGDPVGRGAVRGARGGGGVRSCRDPPGRVRISPAARPSPGLAASRAAARRRRGSRSRGGLRHPVGAAFQHPVRDEQYGTDRRQRPGDHQLPPAAAAREGLSPSPLRAPERHRGTAAGAHRTGAGHSRAARSSCASAVASRSRTSRSVVAGRADRRRSASSNCCTPLTV
jgi:hypothetical protein